jgi:hypothetical protein
LNKARSQTQEVLTSSLGLHVLPRPNQAGKRNLGYACPLSLSLPFAMSKTSNTSDLSPHVALGVALGLVLLAMLGRFVSIHGLGNFTPVGAVALFAGCYLKDRKLALLVPFTALLLTDCVIGLHSLLPVVYACFGFTVWLGMRLASAPEGSVEKHVQPKRVLGGALLSALCFFVVTNFAVWASTSMYAHTGAGLVQCFTMALPFFRNDLAGTLVYSALLFGGYALYQQRVLRGAAQPVGRG